MTDDGGACVHVQYIDRENSRLRGGGGGGKCVIIAPSGQKIRGITNMRLYIHYILDTRTVALVVS